MLDLTHLKALKLPTAIVDVDIMGNKQAVKVTAPDDETALNIAELATMNMPGAAITVEIAKVIMSACTDLTAEESTALIEKALITAVMPIMAKANELRKEFERRRAEFTEQNKREQQEQNGAEPATATAGN